MRDRPKSRSMISIDVVAVPFVKRLMCVQITFNQLSETSSFLLVAKPMSFHGMLYSTAKHFSPLELGQVKTSPCRCGFCSPLRSFCNSSKFAMFLCASQLYCYMFHEQ